MGELQYVTDATFESQIRQPRTLALVDFWGNQGAACRQTPPILRELAESYAGRVKVVKVHATENAQTSARYGVRSMPTILAFRDGEVRGQLVGTRKKAEFEDLIGRLLQDE